MISEIYERRSIRKYKDTPVSQKDVETIIQAGIAAPSSKNRQPWRFVVVTGHKKEEMLQVMKQGLEREAVNPLLSGSRQFLSGAWNTLGIMEEAPVLICVVNPLGLSLKQILTEEEKIHEICNAQSVGAAVQNMSLAAVSLGLGSLWVCDTYFAYPELCGWLKEKDALYAVLAIGYGDENPPKRPRKQMKEVTTWLE